MPDTFRVKMPGILTTIQDLGRTGYGQYGIPVGGVMDRFSFRVANLLVGNSPEAAGLEITLHRLKLETIQSVRVAVAGGNMNPVVDGIPLPMWQSVGLPASSTLFFKEIRQGARAYLAVEGGIDAPCVLGSRSTHQKALLGTPVKKEDILCTLPTSSPTAYHQVPKTVIPKFPEEAEIRVIMGPQDDHFTPQGIDTFLSASYTITGESDRQGYRLKGPAIAHCSGADIISDPILPGSIQVPGNGQPIIMMMDAQTTGGYTKIACVISPDIDILAQLLPGRKIRFRKVSIEEAHTILGEREAFFTELKARLIPCESVFSKTQYQS
jgi:antagonist of KipI